jgi:hypothetical protein
LLIGHTADFSAPNYSLITRMLELKTGLQRFSAQGINWKNTAVTENQPYKKLRR